MTSITISVLTVLGLLGGLFSPQGTVNSQSGPSSQGVVFAVDVSANMAGAPLADEIAAVQAMVDKLDVHTPVALVSFGSHVQIVQRATTQRAYLQAALQTLRVEGGTALYDGTLTAVKVAGRLPASRRLVVLLAGNAEQARQSMSSADAALALAKQRGVAVYSLRWGSRADSAYLMTLATGTHAVSYALGDKTAMMAVANSTENSAAARKVVDVKLTGATQTPRLLTTNNLPTQASVVLAFDVSTGMSGALLRSAQAAAHQFVVQAADNTAIALVTYGSVARVAQPFTVDKDVLNAAIDTLRTGNGATALYDGTTLAINTAATSAASQRSVVLLSGSSEGTRLSKATRQSVLSLLKTKAVAVYGLSLSAKADRAFLQSLSVLSHGSSLDRPTDAQLITFFTTISGSAPLLAAAPATDDTLNGLTSTSTGLQLDNTNAVSNVGAPNIPPLDGSVASLNLPGQTSVDTTKTDRATTVNTTSSVDSAAAALNGNPSAASGAAATSLSATAQGNIVPIHITVPDDPKILSAELAVNGYRLATFEQAPYSYELDTSALRPGNYTLTFTVHTDKGVTSTGSVDFTVAVPTTSAPTTTVELPSLGGASVKDPANVTTAQADSTSPAKMTNSVAQMAGSATNVDNAGVDGTNAKPAASATVLTPAQRLVLLNGQSRPFTFDFSLSNGLSVGVEVSASAPRQNLLSILSKPLDYLPPAVRDALSAQHPTFWAIIILLLSLIFLPQAAFTLYWMLYTWNNPETAEEYRSPREFVAPQHGFTAILPARHEAGVIQDTIRAVDRIHYPDHLKEILVMIRDEDDDDTIRRAQQTIDELGKSNIRLITFTGGPKNKPNGLNRGLAAASKDVVCVFDAEDEPHPDLYDVINTVMIRDEADVVQSGVQLMNFMSNWFAALNCMEYFFWFKSGLHCFTRALKVTPLGGNTVFFKKHWLQRINGWDEHCLTEDADVGLRLSLLGAKIQIVYDAQHATQEETPATAESFIKQRTRWCQGFYEIFFKGDWAKLPTLKQKVTALYILLNSLLQAGIILYLPLGLYVALTQHVSVPVSLLSYLPIFMLLLQLAVTLVGIREFADAYHKPLPFGFRFKVALVYYPYQLMQALAALRAVQHFLLRKNAWEKTSHANLHRQPLAQQSA